VSAGDADIVIGTVRRLPVSPVPVYAVHRRHPSAPERIVLELLEILAGALLPEPTSI